MSSRLHDAMDSLAGVTDALGGETRYSYDRNYNLASVTNTLAKTYNETNLFESGPSSEVAAAWVSVAPASD